MTVKQKLATLVAGMLLLALALGIAGLAGIHFANESLRTVYEDRAVALEQVSRIDALSRSQGQCRQCDKEPGSDPTSERVRLVVAFNDG